MKPKKQEKKGKKDLLFVLFVSEEREKNKDKQSFLFNFAIEGRTKMTKKKQNENR